MLPPHGVWVTEATIRQELGTPPMAPNAHRSRSISDVSSFSTVSVLSFDPIRVMALCVEVPPRLY